MVSRVVEPLHERVDDRALVLFAAQGFLLWFSWHTAALVKPALASALRDEAEKAGEDAEDHAEEGAAGARRRAVG